MKRKSYVRSRVYPGWFARCWRLGVMTVVPCVLLPAVAQDEEFADESEADVEAEAEEVIEFSEWRGGNVEYVGWVDVGMGGVAVDGNEAEFSRRTGINSGAFGGINDGHWEKYVGENGLITIDGKFVPGNEDYRFKIKWLDSEKGFLGVGYRQYRVFYGGTGGFEPQSGAWIPHDEEDLYVDRGEFWVEGGLTLPDWPVFTVRYAHEFREGTKDSTIWGASSASNSRGVAASFRGIDEQRDIVDGGVSHTVGNTDFELGLRYEHSDLDHSLNLHQQASRPDEIFITQNDSTDVDLFNVHASSVTRFNEQVALNTGYSFTTVNSDTSGSRIYGAHYDPIYDPSLARGAGYIDLNGSARLVQHVLALNLMYVPIKSLSIVPSVRIESQGTDADSAFLATPGATASYLNNSNNDYLDFSERLEARYTGVPNWVFYTRGDWAQGDGNLDERQSELTGNTVTLARDTDFDRLTQKYTAGANWYPLRKVNFSLQGYYKSHENDYSDNLDSTADGGFSRYPAYLQSQDFTTHDVNMRVTWRPASGVVSVSRYDYQVSEIETVAAGLSGISSADVETHILSQSLSWSPISRLYMQGTFSYILDSTSTPANESPSREGLVLESENDYWTGSFAVGFVVDERTDLDAEYTYYEADNYVDNSAVSQPYGAGFTEHRFVVTATRRITENLRGQLRYGYFTNDDETYGGYYNYDAHLVYASMQYRF